jgi:phosphoserine phosphatase RsbU/P
MTARETRTALEGKLRDIEAITDAELSRLDEDDLLAELLDRTRAILHTDTAAVLLLDRSAGHLIATAAAGLEEEVRQGFRVPVGRGFAGRIAAEHKPLIIDHVDDTTVVNPILIAKGIRAMLGVPLASAGRVIGVLHVGAVEPREFTDDDVQLLQLAADRAAAAVQSMTARDERVAATALQRSLVPSALPGLPGAEMAARYIPGRGVVGGDWYDVFTLPTGRVCVVMGDVAGSGLPAAVIMGRMRSALRAYALETRDPAEVLRRLDYKMQHFEPDALATVQYAVIDPHLHLVDISSAGHLPPVIAAPGRPAELAELPADLMIGVAPDAPRHMSTLRIEPGSIICFYTDGLVERPDQPLDEGFGRLLRAVTAQPAEAACSAVMNSLVGNETARDDIALLMLRLQHEACD